MAKAKKAKRFRVRPTAAHSKTLEEDDGLTREGVDPRKEIPKSKMRRMKREQQRQEFKNKVSVEVEKKKSKKRAQQQSSEMDVSVKDTAVSDRHDSIHFSKEFTTTMHEADVSDDQKYRHVNIEKETEQFSAVLDHPQFRANPFATIQEHLVNRIALQK